jgi:PAS domain S-box-containing protein
MRAGTKTRTKNEGTVSLPHDALDSMPSGAIKVNRQGVITYANKAFCETIGVSSSERLNIRDLILDESNYEEVASNLESRFSKRVGNEYRSQVTHRGNGKPIPVNIIAVPETDEKGEVVGSFAFIKDLTLESAIQKIHHHIETEHDWQKMLNNIAPEIEDLIEFDWLTVSIYSADLGHTRLLFDYTKDAPPQWSVRWFKLPTVALRLLEKKRPVIIDDFEEFLSGPEWEEARQEPDTQYFLSLGFRSCLWYPVLEGQIVAGFALYKKQTNAYREEDINSIEALPVRRAISMALHNLEREDRDFRLELMRDIAAADLDLRRAAQLLVERVARHYQWDHVSLFRVNESSRKFELMAQEASSDDFKIPEDYAQNLDAGVLGYVYESRQYVNSGDVHTDPALADRFKAEVNSKIVSEVAIPIIVEGQVCAVLNSEDSRKNAYSEEERLALELVLREVSGLYKRLELQQILCAIQESTRDAIIRTDSEVIIQQVNFAATALLGYEEDELVGTPISRYFADKELASSFVESESPPGDQVELVKKSGEQVGVLLSGSMLPGNIGGRVYTASDLSWRKRVERLEFLREMYREIGDQSHVPLSLCFSWLKKLLRNASEDQNESLDKIIRQLRKVQLSFDRLSLFEREGTTMPFNPILTNLPYIFDGIISEFPQEEMYHVNLNFDENLPLVRGDVFQLSFCFSSALSYFLQFVSEDGKVDVDAHSVNGKITVTIKGKSPPRKQNGADGFADESWLAHALFELAVGRETMQGFMSKHGGSFDGPRRSGDDEELDFVIPAAQQ